MDASSVPVAAVKQYAPIDYAVGREKIREYAMAVGESDPVHDDPRAARAAGFRDVVAPPMFAVVYTARAILQVLNDPELAMDLSRVVHGTQEFVWEGDVVAGDEITTVCSVIETFVRGANEFYVVETHSRNQRGEVVCVGTWTFIVRGS